MNTHYPEIYDDPEFRAQMLGIPYKKFFAVTLHYALPGSTVVTPHRHVTNSEALAVRWWHEREGENFKEMDFASPKLV